MFEYLTLRTPQCWRYKNIFLKYLLKRRLLKGFRVKLREPGFPAFPILHIAARILVFKLVNTQTACYYTATAFE